MMKVIGQHQTGKTMLNDRSNVSAVLECGHEVPVSEVKRPDNLAKCPKGCDHDELTQS